jgi:hypothetical protein
VVSVIQTDAIERKGLKQLLFEPETLKSVQPNIVLVCTLMSLSGSIADSVVYGAICGSIFASLPALDTHVVAFDTEVVDLTEKCGNDPVNMIFGVQLGGTDINKAVAYCEKFIDNQGGQANGLAWARRWGFTGVRYSKYPSSHKR